MELQRVRHDLAIEQQQNNILPVGKKKKKNYLKGLDPLLFIFWNKQRQGKGEAWNNFLTIFSIIALEQRDGYMEDDIFYLLCTLCVDTNIFCGLFVLNLKKCKGPNSKYIE